MVEWSKATATNDILCQLDTRPNSECKICQQEKNVVSEIAHFNDKVALTHFRTLNLQVSSKWSVIIGIMIRSAAWYNWVKQRRPRLVLGWMTVVICKFLVIVFWIRLYSKALCSALAATVWISLSFGSIQCNFYFHFQVNVIIKAAFHPYVNNLCFVLKLVLSFSVPHLIGYFTVYIFLVLRL